jgi:hypothetical protein
MFTSITTCMFLERLEYSFSRYIKSATGASGLTATAQGEGGAQIRRKLRGGVWGFRAPPLNLYSVAVRLFCHYYKTQGPQTYKSHLVVRTPLYRHTTIIAHEFSPNKSQCRNCTAALQHLEVWPPSKGLCLPSESPQPAREEEGSCVWHYRLAVTVRDSVDCWQATVLHKLNSCSAA